MADRNKQQTVLQPPNLPPRRPPSLYRM